MSYSQTIQAYVDPPAIAQAAGCNVRTLGPEMRLHDNWREWEFLTAKPICGQAIQNSDGSITLPGADGSNYGANICTANKAGGLYIGGTNYLDFVMKFKPVLGPARLPFPALWALDRGFLTGTPSNQWKGQVPGFNRRIETDYFQWPRDSLDFWTGPGVIDWFGQGNLNNPRLSNITCLCDTGRFSCDPASLITGNYVTIIGGFTGPGLISGYLNPTPYVMGDTNGSTEFTLLNVDGSAIQSTPGAVTGPYFSYNNVTQPTQMQGFSIKMPFSFEDYNHWSFLTTVSSAKTRGSVISFLNGVQVAFAAGGLDPAWDPYDENLPPPPKLGTTAGSPTDVMQFALIAGTGPDMPMQLAEVSCWQPNHDRNVIIH